MLEDLLDSRSLNFEENFHLQCTETLEKIVSYTSWGTGICLTTLAFLYTYVKFFNVPYYCQPFPPEVLQTIAYVENIARARVAELGWGAIIMAGVGGMLKYLTLPRKLGPVVCGGLC